MVELADYKKWLGVMGILGILWWLTEMILYLVNG